jgi:hypothetical protein
LQHARVVCCSPRCSYLSFPNVSTLSWTNTSIFKSYFVPREVTCIVSTDGHHRYQFWRGTCCLQLGHF